MSPTLVRRLILPLHERVRGRRTLALADELCRSESWPAERLAALQQAKLARILEVAATQTPFYRERLAAAGISPRRVTLADLPAIPLLTKADIRVHLDGMIWRGVPGGLHRATTGGSTGQPVAFCMDRARQAADQAARIRSRRWFGIEPGERELYLWGSPIETGAADAFRSMRDRMINHRLISAFRMTPARMADYLREIRSFDPVHLFGYPSSLATLARFALSQSARPPTPALKAVFTTGETLDSADRALLAAYFRVPVADGYGAREAGFIAHECPHGRMHIAAECVLVELLDDAGRAVPVGESGEVVVTNLDNLGMPLIRYRTGDTAWLDARPCPCGRTLPVLGGIEGRQTDRLVRADGGSAHALSAIYVLRDEAGVTRFHVRQRSDLSLDVRIVPAPGWNDDTSNRVSDRLSRQLGGVPVRLSLVQSIEPSGSGKFRCVESEAIT